MGRSRLRVLVTSGTVFSGSHLVREPIGNGCSVIVLDGFSSGKAPAIASALRHVDRDVGYVVFTDADYTQLHGTSTHIVAILDKYPNVGMVLPFLEESY